MACGTGIPSLVCSRPSIHSPDKCHYACIRNIALDCGQLHGLRHYGKNCRPYISFASTIPFRLLFGIPTWIAIILWYHLIVVKNPEAQEDEFIVPQAVKEEKPEEQEETINRITVKDGSRIHIIKVDELLYIQACGDYTTLITPTGEYIKEQTMKYFERHLPSDNFVRIHRSTIVNVTQISRVELFGKETYQVLLKNGTKLRVSLTGYRLLKERLGI